MNGYFERVDASLHGIGEAGATSDVNHASMVAALAASQNHSKEAEAAKRKQLRFVEERDG